MSVGQILLGVLLLVVCYGWIAWSAYTTIFKKSK